MYSKSSTSAALLILSSLFQSQNSVAFVTTSSPALVQHSTFGVPRTVPTVVLQAEASTDEDGKANADMELEEPKLTESGLPELKGDFDWDAKFAGDDDWITENVPGKVVLDDVTLAKQVTALDKLETVWRKQRLEREYDAGKKVGWVADAETMNGRFAMFFLVTGLLTEFWTGISVPGQVEEMLRIAGVIGFDG